MFQPSIIKHWTIPSIFVFAALTLVFTLTGAQLAQAGGFNVDSLVIFTPLSSTYRTTTNTTGCPAGYVGKFIFTAQLTNKSDSPALPGLDVLVQTLTNGNVLLDPQTNAVLGGEGAVMEILQVGQYADGLLSADETVDVPFVVCLKTRQSFQFFLDVFGVVTELVSINRSGTRSGNGDSGGNNAFTSSLSADGRFVAFVSGASDLVANDTNASLDVFVRDTLAGTTALVSANQLGTDTGNGGSLSPMISADGRFVAFTSVASDLVAIDTNARGCAPSSPFGSDCPADVFVRDLQMGTTTLVSVNRFGTSSGNSFADNPALSANGRFVAFRSFASDLVPTDTNGTYDFFIRDLQTGTTRLVSVNRAGTDSGNGFSGGQSPLISADGRFVAFVSEASDLVATDTNGVPDVFVRDLTTGTTTLVSVNQAGTDSGHAGIDPDQHPNGSYSSTMSADGRFVAFTSFSTDLVANDTNGWFDVFVRDLKTGTTALVSVNHAGTDSSDRPTTGQFTYPPSVALSANGRFVAFESGSSDLVAIDMNGTSDVFVRDLKTGTTTLVSVNEAGTDSGRPPTECHPEPQGCIFRPFGSGGAVISADGRFVAFLSSASDLVAIDTNGDFDVFVRDLKTGTTTLINVNEAGTDSGNVGSLGPVISADGRFVAFTSNASDLVATDTNGRGDVFVRPVP